jgi:putative acetyltransferase
MCASRQPTIRAERIEDRDDVRAVLCAAFRGDLEAELVERLWADGDALVSLVAAEGHGTVVGHVLFSPLAIETQARRPTAAALAPLAVAPGRQRRGIGAALVLAGLEACRAKGIEAVVVVGDPAYYRRFGFSVAAAAALASPFAGEHCMALALAPGLPERLEGRLRYARAFDPLVPIAWN